LQHEVEEEEAHPLVPSERRGVGGVGRTTARQEVEALGEKPSPSLACRGREEGAGGADGCVLQIKSERKERRRGRTTQRWWSRCGGHAPRVLFVENTTATRKEGDRRGTTAWEMGWKERGGDGPCQKEGKGKRWANEESWDERGREGPGQVRV
jgi:hypothetical protein